MVINHICPIQALAIGAAEPWDFFYIFFFWSGPYPALGRELEDLYLISIRPSIQLIPVIFQNNDNSQKVS